MEMICPSLLPSSSFQTLLPGFTSTIVDDWLKLMVPQSSALAVTHPLSHFQLKKTDQEMTVFSLSLPHVLSGKVWCFFSLMRSGAQLEAAVSTIGLKPFLGATPIKGLILPNMYNSRSACPELAFLNFGTYLEKTTPMVQQDVGSLERV